MNNWIEINLPWIVDDVDSKIDLTNIVPPHYPTEIVDKLIIDKFGSTPTQFRTAFSNKYGISTYDVKYFEDNEYYYEDMGDCETDEIDVKFCQERYNEALRIDKLCNGEILEYERNLPEVHEFNKQWEEFTKKLNEARAKKCFRYSDLCRPGVLIMVNRNDKIGPYLIGHIVPSGELGGDHSVFDESSIVLKAKIVWEDS
jgi:hypothetical protein